MSAYPDGWPSQLFRISGVLLYVHLSVHMIEGLEYLVAEQQGELEKNYCQDSLPVMFYVRMVDV